MPSTEAKDNWNYSRSLLFAWTIPYYHFAEGKVAGVQCFISRTGYTGEDGFELYCRGADLEKLWHALVGAGRAEPCGLGARDTLRLEAGYPLYGSDIDATVTPYEAGLGWIVKLEKGAAFTGLAALKRQRLEGVPRRLVGFRVSESKTVARHGYPVFLDGAGIGAPLASASTIAARWSRASSSVVIVTASTGRSPPRMRSRTASIPWVKPAMALGSASTAPLSGSWKPTR